MANHNNENNQAREPPVSKSRLEINFIRLLEETQQMANGNKPKDWTFEKGRRMVVLYGSQTGTAQEVAERVGRESRRYYLEPVVSAMDDFSVDQFIEEEIVVFVVATTGQGDDPENMRNFFSSLWALRQNRKVLHRLKFAVLGLGDSSYQKFNYSAKRMNNLLTFLGGQTIVKIGLGDDQHDLGPDFVIDPWLQELWSKMLTIYPLPEGVKPISSKTLPMPKYKVKFHDKVSSSFENDNREACNSTEVSQNNPFYATLSINRRITAEDHFQDVRLIELDVSNSKLKHSPGDVVMVQPQNLEEHVEEFIQVLGLDPDIIFSIEPNDPNIALPPKHILPCPCSVRHFVKNYLDIQSVPKRFFFELIAFFTKDDLEKEKFEEFASAAGQQDMYDYCHRPRRSIMEILADFPNTNHSIPFEYLFDLIPAIRPRAYSIASSSLALPGKIQILSAVVKYKTILKRPRLGLCTNWLARQATGASIPIWIKAGTLHFPKPDFTDKPPVIMIGTGTGCAPFRAYIQEYMVVTDSSADQSTPKSTSSLVLFFGCRYKDKDYLCRDDWEPFAQEGRLELHCAFSRDQEDKIYVQHRIRDVADHLWNLMGEQKALIYFAGNAKRVPIDVYEALRYVCARGLGCKENEAEEFMKKQIEKRYQTETWA